MPDFQKLKELLAYDSESGIFTWKKAHGRGIACTKAGDRAGGKNWCGHRLIGIDGRRYREHRLAYEFVFGSIPNAFEIDHINGVYDDNRIANLRLATHQQNL